MVLNTWDVQGLSNEHASLRVCSQPKENARTVLMFIHKTNKYKINTYKSEVFLSI